MNRLLTAGAAFAALALCAGAASAQNFRALAQQDLTAAHDQLRDNHPAAAIDSPTSAAFRSWLDAGLADAQSKLGSVNSGDSHAYLMRYYATGFRDTNISIEPTYEASREPWFSVQWPGFATAWQNGQYVVSYVKAGVRGPRVGDILQECDGMPVADMAKKRLDGFEGDLTTEAGRIATAPFLTWNRNNPFGGQVPGECKFGPRAGRGRAIKLTPIPNDMAGQEAAYRATLFAATGAPLAVEQVNGRPWIHVHTLLDTAGWDAFFASVEGQLPALRAPAGFVLDLRGANGVAQNAVAHGYGLANRIWTPEFTVSRQPAAGELTYRASAGNREWFAGALGRMQADPVYSAQNPAVVENTAAVVAGFDAAIASGQRSFTVPGRAGAADTGAANPVQGPVVVLIDGGCSGGCLDLLDLLVGLPNVKLVGTPTASDSYFIEPTVLRLPSNYANLSYGHKAWATRPRGANQPHTPAVAYTGSATDEAGVRAWVGSQF